MKDRERIIVLSADVRVVFTRSSTHPVVYAITLIVTRSDGDHAVVVFDNTHAPDEHHEHRYVGDEKQPPAVTRGAVNDAMHAALLKLMREWRDIVASWESP